MVDGDILTGLIKVYQVLEKTLSMTELLSEGHYTVLSLEHLLLVDGRFSLNTLLQSTTAPHLLMMSCETSQLLNFFFQCHHMSSQTSWSPTPGCV